MKTQQTQQKTQILIFLAVAFALPFALGIPMGIFYYKGVDLSAFPTAQMYYPAAGVMLAALITRKGDALLPKRFFIGFIATTAVMLAFALASIIAPSMPWYLWSQYCMMALSLICLVLLFTEKREKRAAYGLRGGHWGVAALIVLLYLVLYLGRTAFGYFVMGEAGLILTLVQDPTTWIYMASLAINYFLVFTAFFGEEYGWRYYLQPILQKKFGMVRGVLLLGIVWGLWHLPINFFYYTSPSIGLISVAGQIITCITLGAFYGWAYLKTNNIWLPVILHFVNNNLIPIITGTYSADVLQNQQMGWGDILFSLVVNGVLFLWVLFLPLSRDKSRRLPTLDERANQSAGQPELDDGLGAKL